MLKTETAADRRGLGQAVQSLASARRGLKAFAQTKTVQDSPRLAQRLKAARKQLKKARRCLEDLVVDVDGITESTDDETTTRTSRAAL